MESDKRSIANALQVFFKDGSYTELIEIEYPVGHRRRRQEGIPLLEAKFKANLATRYVPQRSAAIFDLCADADKLNATAVHRFVEAFVL